MKTVTYTSAGRKKLRHLSYGTCLGFAGKSYRKKNGLCFVKPVTQVQNSTLDTLLPRDNCLINLYKGVYSFLIMLAFLKYTL